MPTHVVAVDGGGQFGPETMRCLGLMQMMVVFAFEDYGQKTMSPYCSYAEVKYYIDNMADVKLLPLKLYAIGDFDAWPPKPSRRNRVYDGRPENDGVMQNKFAFTGDMIVREFDPRSAGGAVACAKYIVEQYAKLPGQAAGRVRVAR